MLLLGRRSPFVGGKASWLWLFAIVLVAASLRAVGFDWDEGKQLHPDERFLSMVTAAIDPAASLREYLDTERSPLNPNNRNFGFFVYGTFPLVLVQYLGLWFELPGNDLDLLVFGRALGSDFASVRLIGRGLSLGCDVAVVLLVFAAGRRLYGAAAALVAALLYSLAVLPIQQAHFFTVDAIANFFVMLAFWLAVRATSRAHWADDLLFGLALGAGLACKLSILPVALLLVLAVGVRFGVAPLQPEAAPSQPAWLARAALSVNVMLLAGLLSFRLLQPYAFVPPYGTAAVSADEGGLSSAAKLAADILAPQINAVWLEQMGKVRALQRGDDDAPPNHQWANRRQLVFPWYNLVRFGLGWPFGLLAWCAWGWAAVEGLRGRGESWRHVLPVAWIGLYFAWYGAGWVTTMRYFLPLYPVLAILAGWAIVRLVAPERDLSADGTAPARWLRRFAGGLLAAVVIVATLVWALAFTSIYTRPHPRLAASRWIYAHVPADISLHLDSADGAAVRPLGLRNSWLPAGESADHRTAPAAPVSRLEPDVAAAIEFEVAAAARLRGITLHDVTAEGAPAVLELELLDATSDDAALMRCRLVVDRRQRSAEPSCDGGAALLEHGRKYRLQLIARGAPLVVRGSDIANEGHWDDAVPLSLPGYDGWQALYQMRGLEMAWEDDADKRARMQHILDGSDYLTISSNRFYDSLSRNRRRWPMTIEYYRALFAGELGLELVADFASQPCFAGYCWDDREAEEAFSVYDHPRVFVFRKTAAYDPANIKQILARANLRGVQRLRADEVVEDPVHLNLRQPPR